MFIDKWFLSIIYSSLQLFFIYIIDHFKYIWNVEIPKGNMNRNQLPYLFNQLLHIAIRTIHDIVLEIIDINQFKNLLYDDDLFIECQEFIDLRYKFETRWLDLTKQRVLLENCRNQVDNEHVRNMLIQAYEASSSIYKDDKLR